MSIAITGATGNLGNLVIQELLEKELEETVVAVVRNEEKAKDQLPDTVEIRYGDYASYDSLVNAFQGIRKLLFISSPSTDDMERVIQHATVVKAARDAAVEQIFYTSFSNADHSTIPLAKLHLATEAAIKVSGLAYTFIRNPLYTEVFINSSLNKSIASGKLVANTGDGKLNTTSRKDLAKATATLLSQNNGQNEIIDLASSQPWSYQELATTLSETSGKTVTYEPVSYEEVLIYFKNSGLPKPAAEFSASMNQAIAQGDIKEPGTDINKLIDQEISLKDMVSKVLTIG
ncbi:SDR family oxidoreductase [Marinilactibacillus psychrotolerans]|uniref:SDR family oxidoreductase n=1 Tax=Marinilactibacillus psychrotolerans TaxID=191770 RepID=A0A5R9C4Z6_9LACT|nr:SDR family oxidoreductase [Marinilactibacillus psychrotolerans]TLQ07958.1 SDR family oxidoreductase [Marinilactibacillus psychrotolerans]